MSGTVTKLNVVKNETYINESDLIQLNIVTNPIIENFIGSPGPAGRDGDGSALGSLLPFTNVKDIAFGAQGDGVTDDTAAIQAAIDYMSHGGTLYFPEGEYLCGQLYINRFNIKFMGVSNANNGMQTNGQLRSSAIRFNNTSGDCLYINTPGFNIKQIMFQDLMFKGVTTAGSILSFDNVSWITLKNVIVNHAAGAAYPAVRFDKCFIINCTDFFVIKSANDRYPGSTGISITLADGTLAGLFSFYNTSVLEYDTGLTIGDQDYATTTRYRNLNFIGCQAKSCNRGLLINAGVENANIQGSYFEGNLISAIDIWKGAANCTISTSYFNNPTASNADIRLGRSPTITGDDYVRNVKIERCSFDNVKTRGIYIYANSAGSSGIKIEGNTFKEVSGGSSAIGIKVSGSARVTEIDSNYFHAITTKVSADQDTLLEIKKTDNYYQSANVETISGLRQLSYGEPIVQTFEPLTTDRIVKLPNPSTAIGQMYIINCSYSSLKDVVIQRHDGLQEYVRVKPGRSAYCVNDGVNDFVELFNIDNKFYSLNIETIATAKVLTDSDARIQSIKTTTANYAVRLPAPVAGKIKEFLITCASDSTKNLVIRDSTNAVTYANLAPGNTVSAWNDGVNNYVKMLMPGDRLNIIYSSSAPVSGSFSLGDIVYNTSPSAGGFVGWICTQAGTPGTWKTFGAISA
ncbi:MAG: right-handed parallel beta-helix repeat-containing protein [Nitrosomonas sp.]|nr:right-handed parallel beta-helix repeat-containing protein [Nitrosomonas sp.]